MGNLVTRTLLRMTVVGIGIAGLGCAGEPKWDGEVDVSPARGTLTVAGAPLPGAHLILHPVDANQKLKPQAYTGPDGAFAVTAFRTGDGAPPGEYVVTVGPNPHPEMIDGRYVEADTNVRTKAEEAKAKIPPKFTKRETSPLKITVKKDAPELGQLDLK